MDSLSQTGLAALAELRIKSQSRTLIIMSCMVAFGTGPSSLRGLKATHEIQEVGEILTASRPAAATPEVSTAANCTSKIQRHETKSYRYL